MELSIKAKNLKPSPTLFLVARAKELIAEGHDVISLTVGEPDWSTFVNIKVHGINAINENKTKYTPAQGLVELRRAVCEKYQKDHCLTWRPSEVCIGPGAKFLIFSAIQMLCNPQDEVIISAPYWVSYPTMIELSGAVPRIIDTTEKTNFKVNADELSKCINAKTKAFLFCSPSNPTGKVYSVEELKSIAEVLRSHPHVCIISDDMYNELMFDGTERAPHILDVAPELKDRTLLINGGSKAYAMTGWRIGWGLGPQKLITAIADYQSQATGAPSSIAQYALIENLNNSHSEIQKVRNILIQRKKHCIAKIENETSFKVEIPDGAFYLWISIKSVLGKTYNNRVILGSKEFCNILLEEYYVATVPGIESGTEGYLRLSFATSLELFDKAIERMKQFISKIN